MSLSRFGSSPEWFRVSPGYVYVKGDDSFNTGIWDVTRFCELSMRALAQSGELDDETLSACQQALVERFSYVDLEVVEL